MPGNMWDTRFVCFCIDNSQATPMTGHTLEAWFCWGLLELQQGHYLDVDPYGERYEPYYSGRQGTLAGGFRGVLMVHKGDEKYIQRAYKTSHSWVSENICLLCKASSKQPSLLYTEFLPTAGHRSTMLKTEQFIADVCQVKTFCNIPGWHIEMLQHDLLHVLDLAIIPECAASTLTLWFNLCIDQGFGCFPHIFGLVGLFGKFETWGLCLRVELCATNSSTFGNGTMDEKLQFAYHLFCRACKHAKISALVACNLHHETTFEFRVSCLKRNEETVA